MNGLGTYSERPWQEGCGCGHNNMSTNNERPWESNPRAFRFCACNRAEGLDGFQHCGDAHSRADALGGQTVFGVRASQLVGQGQDQAPTSGTKGMADGQCASIDIQFLHRDTQFPGAGDDLGGEGFIELDTIDLVHS
jgi:hypothetical protein